MQFSRNSSRFAVVAALHVGLGALFIHGMNHKTFLSHIPDAVMVVMQPEPPVEPPPPDPPRTMAPLAPPELVVPRAEVDVAPPPQPAPVTATVDAEPTPFPVAPAIGPSEPPATPGSGTGTTDGAGAGRMHTAVLADAKNCALPDYPARAARNGDSGTTTLALLVGIDGRVSSARVEHTSGSRDLDRAAVSALSLCRFKPATNNGVAEAGWAQLAYVWTLD